MGPCIAMGAAAAHALDLIGEKIQRATRVARQPAVGQLLDPACNPYLQKGPAVVRRCCSEEAGPFLFQLFHGHGLQRRQSRQDGCIHLAILTGPW